MNNTTLQNFLIDDVRALIDAIRDNEELAAQAIPGGGFDTLNDFANYWGRHINSITVK